MRHRLKLLLLRVHLLPGGDCEHGVEDGHVQLVAHGNGLADLGKKREKTLELMPRSLEMIFSSERYAGRGKTCLTASIS